MLILTEGSKTKLKYKTDTIICVTQLFVLHYVFVWRVWGERRGVYRVLVGKPEGKRQLGRPRRRWEDNIKMKLQEVGWGLWTGSSWLRIGTGDL